jgi:excisionase family DNA binding protein
MRDNGMELLTTDEAAAYLHKSASTLEKYRVAGSGPAYRKLGRHVLYRRGELDRWVEAQSCRSTAEYERRAA